MWKKFCKTMSILDKNCMGLSPCVEEVWINNTGLIIFYFYCLNFSIKQCWLWEIKPNKNLIFTEYTCTIYNERWLRERNQNKDPKWKKMQIWNISEHTCAIYCMLVYPNEYECSLWPKSHSCIFPINSFSYLYVSNYIIWSTIFCCY